METTYKQVIDQETGEIKYVPTSPPPPKEEGGTETTTAPAPKSSADIADEYYTDLPDIPTEVFAQLRENAKRLRFNRRLTAGKLDGRRLAHYRTSDRLFKKKAIKNRKYQFTFLVDTSGSMGRAPNSKIGVAIKSILSIGNSLSDLGYRHAVFGMNGSFELLKGLDQDVTDQELAGLIYKHRNNGYSGGTAEGIAYEETVKYLEQRTPSGYVNVVIILSDGEPGWRGEANVKIGDDIRTEEENVSSSDSLSKFWAKRPHFKSFGIGIFSKARQVPNNRTVHNLDDLPKAINNLIEEIMR